MSYNRNSSSEMEGNRNSSSETEGRLELAAKEGDIGWLYLILEENPFILETIHKKPFTNTPLHISASLGHTEFALEIMNLMPSFGKKLNAQGLSPLHLALPNPRTGTAQGLIKFHPELIRVRGRERITPLHYAAELDKVDLLAEFLLSSPSSVRDLTVRGETALHVAVKNTKLSAFKVLIGMVRRTGHIGILNWKDKEGNTVLHIAASTNQPEVLKLLADMRILEVNQVNLEGKTALDIAKKVPLYTNVKIRKTLKSATVFEASSLLTDVTAAEFLSSRPNRFIESFYALDFYLNFGLSGDMRNALLVVAALIATATYQTLLQPPGGFSQPTDTSHQLLDSHVRLAMSDAYYYIMILLNTMAFATSMGILLLLIPSGVFIFYLRFSVVLFFCNYMWSLYIISPQSTVVKNSLLLLFLPFYILKSARYRPRLRFFRLFIYSKSSPFSPLYRHFRTTRSVYNRYWRGVEAERAHIDIHGT